MSPHDCPALTHPHRQPHPCAGLAPCTPACPRLPRYQAPPAFRPTGTPLAQRQRPYQAPSPRS